MTYLNPKIELNNYFGPIMPSVIVGRAKDIFNEVMLAAGIVVFSGVDVTLSITDSSLSLVKRVVQIGQRVFPNLPDPAPIGAVTSGIALTVGAVFVLPKGVIDLYKSKQIKDGEGVRRASQKIALGSIVTAGSALSLLSSVGTTLARLHIPLFFEIAVLLSILSSGLTLLRCATYSYKIDSFLKNGTQEDVLKTLQFLKGKAESGEVNIKHMSRRSDESKARAIYGKLDESIAALEKSLPSNDEMDAAKQLISELKGEIRKKMILTSIGLCSSVIAFTALMLTEFTSGGLVPLILFTISTSISLGLLLYPIIERRLVQPQPVIEMVVAQHVIDLDEPVRVAESF